MSLSVPIVDVGTPSPEFQGWERAEVRFHGFAEMSAETGDYEESSEFTCLGHQWTLDIYPGGDEDSDEGMVTLDLIQFSDKEINAKFGFSIKDSDGREIASAHGAITLHAGGWRELDFVERSTVLKSLLVEGALVIEVQMRLADPTQKIPPPFIPENPAACKAIQKLFMDERSADIVFHKVEHQKGENNARKKAKTSPTTFHAHRFILLQCAPQLAEMCGPIENNSSPISVTIPNVTPETFHHILNYVYGGKGSDEDLGANARDIIHAADKYGVSNLKLEAEACLVNTTTINVENVMDLLLYSDSKNCALLKEAVMDFIVQNGVDVMEKVSFKDVPGEMIKDVLAATARKETSKGVNRSSNNDQLGTMRITELRRKAHEKGLEVDGSREMLIAALKESS